MKLTIILFYVLLSPFCMGYIWISFWRDSEEGFPQLWWTGFVLELFSFSIIWKIALFFYGDFADICNIFRFINILLAGIALVICIRSKGFNKIKKIILFSKLNLNTILFLFAFLILLFIQLIKQDTIIEIYKGDNMALYVSTIVSDESLFKSNPFTGLSYSNGSTIIEYSVLTVFYAFLEFVFKLHNTAMVYRLIPIWLLCLFYSIQYSLGKELFQNNRNKSLLYCIVVSLINLWAAGKRWILSTYLMYNNWTDDAMQVCLILPLIVWLYLKILSGEKKKSQIVLLIILLWILNANSNLGIYIVLCMGIIYATFCGLKGIEKWRKQ